MCVIYHNDVVRFAWWYFQRKGTLSFRRQYRLIFQRGCQQLFLQKIFLIYYYVINKKFFLGMCFLCFRWCVSWCCGGVFSCVCYVVICLCVMCVFGAGAFWGCFEGFLRRKMPFSSFFSALFCRKKSRFGHVKQG